MSSVRARSYARVLVVCAAAWLSSARPALADPSVAPASPPARAQAEPASQGAHTGACPVCPELADNPFDEPAAGHAVVDLNTADERALLDLPGIGPARARAILAYRGAHGGFHSVSQLLQIRGIGRALLKQLRPLITLTQQAH
jgi:competence protein ComEA